MSDSNMFPGSGRKNIRRIKDAIRINESFDSKESKLYASKKLARFFEVDVTLKIFGQVVFSWHFPPSNN